MTRRRCIRLPRAGLSVLLVLALGAGCTEDHRLDLARLGVGSDKPEPIVWRDKVKDHKVAWLAGPVQVSVETDPAPKIEFQNIEGRFLDQVARGADTGARHGAMLGNFGFTGTCTNSGCAVLLLVTSALIVGGAAVGGVIGAVNGGITALVDGDDAATIAARQQAMRESFKVLALPDRLGAGARQQIYQGGYRQLFYSDGMAMSSGTAKTGAGTDSGGKGRASGPGDKQMSSAEYRLRVTELSAGKDDDGLVFMRVAAQGQVYSPAGSALLAEPVTAEFITQAYPFDSWFQDGSARFRRAMRLGAELTGAKLVEKLGRLLPP